MPAPFARAFLILGDRAGTLARFSCRSFRSVEARADEIVLSVADMILYPGTTSVFKCNPALRGWGLSLGPSCEGGTEEVFRAASAMEPPVLEGAIVGGEGAIVVVRKATAAGGVDDCCSAFFSTLLLFPAILESKDCNAALSEVASLSSCCASDG